MILQSTPSPIPPFFGLAAFGKQDFGSHIPSHIIIYEKPIWDLKVIDGFMGGAIGGRRLSEGQYWGDDCTLREIVHSIY